MNNGRRNTIQEIELYASQLASGENGSRDDAIAAICDAFEPLVQSLAKRYAQPVFGAEPAELEQVARVGLLEACKSFDRSKGAFPTHAKWQMRKALALYVSGLGNPVRFPGVSVRYLPMLRRVSVKLSHELMREPTVEELATAMNMRAEVIEVMLAYDTGPIQLDRETAVNPSPYSRRVSMLEDVQSDEPTPEAILIANEVIRMRLKKGDKQK